MNVIKLFVTLLVFVALGINNSFGQSIKLSAKGGLNVSNTRFSVVVDGSTSYREYDNRASFYLGGSLEFLLLSKNNFNLLMQLELLYSREGTTLFHPALDYRNTFELDQVKLPILLKMELSNKLYLLGGGYIGDVILARDDISGGKKFKRDGYNNFDIGLIIGMEYHYKYGIFIESRYNLGLADVSSVAYPASFIEHNYKNRLFQLGIGYRF
ncbi:MAG: outer membrane beta-barrel protein [Candidatus Lokiarchaeia archaeon]